MARCLTLSSGFKMGDGIGVTQQDRPTRLALNGWGKPRNGLDTCSWVGSRNKFAPSQSHDSVSRAGLDCVKEGRQCQ